MVQQEVTTEQGWSSDPALPILQSTLRMEPLTMKYGQTASSEQMTLLDDEHTTQRKRGSIPIYRVVLVKEGKLPTYESRIRSSANAYAVLREYLADTDRE